MTVWSFPSTSVRVRPRAPAPLHDHVFDVIVTGDDVPALVPENSDVDITIKVDRSQLMKLEVNFRLLLNQSGATLMSKPVQSKITKKFVNASTRPRGGMQPQNTKAITDVELEESTKQLRDIEQRFDGEISTADGTMHLLASLQEVFHSMETVEKNHEWDSLEAELRTNSHS